MAWKKSPPELAALLETALSRFDCRKKIMFGYPAYFVNDQMFAALHQDSLIVRLAEADRQRLLSADDEATVFEPMPGRPMREYVVVPPSLYGDARSLDEWLDRSHRYVQTLPPKNKRPGKTKQ